MDSDSDSDASHVSSTPPRNSTHEPNPYPNPRPSKLFSDPDPDPDSRQKPVPLQKPKPSKTKPKPSKPPPPAAAAASAFPSPDLSSLQGISVVNICRGASERSRLDVPFSRLVKSRRPCFDPSEFAADAKISSCGASKPENDRKVASCEETPVRSVNVAVAERCCPGASFSRFVRSQRSSFDPSEFNADAKISSSSLFGAETNEGIASCEDITEKPTNAAITVKGRPKPKQVHPNCIGFSAQLPELPKTLRCGKEGNFVRLNINGRGRKYGYKNGKRKFSTASRGRRFRRRLADESSKDKAGSDGLEDDGSVYDKEWEQKKVSSSRCRLVDEAVLAAREDPTDENLKNLLKLTHGYDSFREGQLETIKNVVGGASTMLVLPTGAGKSLCYQLPALILPGVTVVVSPLVALMVDQLKKLPSVIPGGLLSSSQTSEEASETLQKLCEGQIKVLFVSPERFLNAEFLSTFENGLPISLVAIDEAHCISEWSHNFRPSYLMLKASTLRIKLGVSCILAMTATATTQTLQDIMSALEILPSNLIKACKIRENLQLHASLSENRLKDLLVLMKSSPLANIQSIIVYCKFQAEADSVSKYLCDNNIPSKSYHSGIPAKYRSRVMEFFCSNKLRVVVATVAFGMGLDKSDVGAVIHYSLPESLEEYVQETGRAGRDGRISYCHLLFDSSTYYKLRSLCYSDGVDDYAVSKFLSDVFSGDAHLNGNICSLVKESISRKFDMKEEVLLTILTQLEMGDEQYVTLLPQLNITCSLYFHKTEPALLSIQDVLIAAILKRSEIKHGHYIFDIIMVANDIRSKPSDILNQLHQLKFLGEITFELKDSAFSFKVVKKPDDLCSLSAKLKAKLSQVECSKVRKLDVMFGVANSAVKHCKMVDGCSGSLHTPCIQRKISEYFSGTHENFHDDFSIKVTRSSPFLRADIKVFLQSNSHTKFTPRAVARIMHGIPSPAFPSASWSKCHFWGRYIETDFLVVMEAAKVELMNFMGQGGE